MGFGSLFIGYFLLLNVVMPGFTNILAACIMMLGLYKLSVLNKPFKLAFFICVGFAVFSLADFVVSVLFMFLPTISNATVQNYFSVLRLFACCILTVAILAGIQDVSNEVELEKIPKRSRVLMYATFAVYMLYMLLSVPELTVFMDKSLEKVLYSIAIFALFGMIIVNLYTIYTCYARICMPGDEKRKEQKPSRFGFVNEYRRHKAEKEQEYAEYRLEKFKAKQHKKQQQMLIIK